MSLIKLTFPQRLAEDQTVTVGDRYRVKQRLFLQIVINQWDYAAEFRQAQPYRNKLRAVFHQQRNLIAMLESVLVEDVCDAIFEVIDLEMENSRHVCFIA